MLALYNIKGGTGKTASAVNLAFLSSLEGKKTLLWDLDPQGAVGYYFDTAGERAGGSWQGGGTAVGIRQTRFANLDLLTVDSAQLAGWPSKRLSRLLTSLGAHYENVFLDCPHDISDVARVVFATPGALLVPTIPTPLSIRTLAQLHSELTRRNTTVRLLPFFCMVDRRKKLHRSTETFARALPLTVLTTEIPYASQVERMAVERAPLARFARSSKPARAYEALWDEIKTALGRRR